MKKVLSMLCMTSFLFSCGDNSIPSSSRRDETPYRYGAVGKDIYFKDGGYCCIKTMEIGNGLLKLSGYFDANREASSFCVYMQLGPNVKLNFELASPIRNDWSIDLHGEKEFSFVLPDNIYDIIDKNKTGCRTDAVYTDFGLGLGTHSYDELGFLDEEIGTEFPFFEYLNSTYFVGDLESVYRIYK